MDNLISRIKVGFGKLWSSWRISLHVTCLLTSAYFVQDGFVTVVDSLFKIFFASSLLLQRQDDTNWRLVDGCILLSLGYMCVLGLENKRLNLVRWPSLLLFIYKVVEYFVEQVFRQLRDHHQQSGIVMYPHPHRLEWTGHFLIPSLHIVSVTVFLYRMVNQNNNGSGGGCSHNFKQFAKFVPLKSRRRRMIRRGGGSRDRDYDEFRDCSTSSLISMRPPPPPPPPLPPPLVTKRRKFTRRKLMNISSTSFCEEEEEMHMSESEDGREDRVCLLEFDSNRHDEE